MKAMTIEEFHVATGARGKDKYTSVCTRLLKDFTESGYEAVELTAEDFHLDEVKDFRAQYLRKKFSSIITALKLESTVGVTARSGNVYLYREDL